LKRNWPQCYLRDGDGAALAALLERPDRDLAGETPRSNEMTGNCGHNLNDGWGGRQLHVVVLS